MKMTRVPLSSVQFERFVKLTPQGKIYKVHSTMGFGRDVVLLDPKGKEVLKGYHTDVYLLPSEFRPTSHALDGRDSAPSQAVSAPEVLSPLQAVSSPALPQVM